jgi:MraZ protein
LFVYSKPAFAVLADRVRELDPFDPDTRTMQRYFFTGAPMSELDRQGRLVVPAKLLESVGISREVTVTGMFDHLEIWDRATWREKLTQAEGSAEDVAERLANRN